MTKFSFSTFNHCPQGQIIVEDITKIMGHQMMALGHEVSWSNDSFIDGDGVYNVILESFADDPSTIERIAEAHAVGCRFIIVATEEPSPEGFNRGLDPAMARRQDAFPAAAKFADGILHLVPGDAVTKWYSQFAPTAYAELGYSPGLDWHPEFVDPEPIFDFGFYGKITWRREQMLARLKTIGSVLRIDSLDVPRDTRDRQMRSARVIVQIRANEEWGMVSSTRCASALFFGRPVIAEPHPHPAPWDKVVNFSKTLDLFYYDAAAATQVWHDLHRYQLAKFKEHLTPQVCIGNPLREIGIGVRDL